MPTLCEIRKDVVRSERGKGYDYWFARGAQKEPVTYEIQQGRKRFQVELVVVERNAKYVQVMVSVDVSPHPFWRLWGSSAESFIVSNG
jgi:hypothetical protein